MLRSHDFDAVTVLLVEQDGEACSMPEATRRGFGTFLCGGRTAKLVLHALRKVFVRPQMVVPRVCVAKRKGAAAHCFRKRRNTWKPVVEIAMPLSSHCALAPEPLDIGNT
jgi:hypothetical protein